MSQPADIARFSIAYLALLALGFVEPAKAFDPPVDQVGPITARIEGPRLVEQAERPVAFHVIVENAGDRPIHGTVEPRGIDRWRVEPASAPFHVRPKEKVSLSFRAIAGSGSFNAFYPLHAFVRFSCDGKPAIAHPIFMVETRFHESAHHGPTPTAAGHPFPPQRDAGARVLGRLATVDHAYRVLLWPGQRGLLDATIGFRNLASEGLPNLYFHGFEVIVDGVRLDNPFAPTVLLEAREESIPNGVRVRHRFRGAAGDFDLVGVLELERGALRARFSLENGPSPRPWRAVWLQDVAIGPWSEKATAVYAGHGNVVRGPQAGEFACDGHQVATRFVGFDFASPFSIVEGVDVVPDRLAVIPEQGHYTLHAPHAQTITLIPAADVWRAVRAWRAIDAVPAADGVSKLAGRFTFDLWGGNYRDNGQSLRRAFRYGLTNAVVVCHYWQRWGYDNRLPDIYPPNPQLGSLDDLQRTIELCRKAGVLVALHDNYMDYYPDAEGFSYEKTVAFDADGKPRKAWFNPGTGVQSYLYRADAIESPLKRNVDLIAKHLGPTAYFVDVWASGVPYDHWTADGAFVERATTREVWQRSFDAIRRRLGDHAPQISESGTDLLLGHLDGAQANHMRIDKTANPKNWCAWPWRCDDAERIPWFDAAHHERFVLQGAGYSSRYIGGLDEKTHGIYSDDYTATCVLTGHPAMVPDAFGRDVVRKYWLTDDLARALALRRIESFEFDGGREGDIHRQHVRWSGGGEVWVNRGATDWRVAGKTLPTYGFHARAPIQGGTVEASLSRRAGAVVESAHSPGRWYVNARGTKTDFGPIVTTGGCRIVREGKTLTITPLPDTPKEGFDVRLRPERLGFSVPKKAVVETLHEEGQSVARASLRCDNDAILLHCLPGAFAYRIVAP